MSECKNPTLIPFPVEGSRGAVIVCPGGGYLNCSDREAEPVALRFAGMGYHAAVLRYSTYGERRDDFARLATDDYLKPHILYPVQMRELGIFIYLKHLQHFRRIRPGQIDRDHNTEINDTDQNQRP